MSKYHDARRMMAQESDGAVRERETHELEEQWSQDPTYDIDLELDMARNMFGKLKPDIRQRIEAVVSNPSQKTWSDAHTIIVGGDGWMTLWQAVIVVDPSFPRSGPGYDDEGEQRVWDEIPDQRTLLKAIRYATH